MNWKNREFKTMTDALNFKTQKIEASLYILWDGKNEETLSFVVVWVES